MRFDDLLTMCIGNLKRRKLRTVLTVLGVVIGTASVVIMTSVGLGMSQMSENMYASFGSLTQVTVHEPYSYEANSKKEAVHLTDETVKEISRLEHVTSISPVISSEVIIKQGLYECSITLQGVDRNYFSQMDMKDGSSIPEPGELSLVMGNAVLARFTNIKTNESYWDKKNIPDVDYSKPLFVIFDTNAYYESKQTNSEKKVLPPKKYVLKVDGELKGEIEDYSDNSMDAFTDIDALKTQLKKVFGKNPIPGQPTTKKGKPLSEFCYNRIFISCDSMDHVVEVQKAIQSLGYEASSNMEWLEQSKQQSNMIQLVLGCIGAISLLVAAIGIANTMMMSIYERTREIGIMKVLGCDINEIRNMFMIESAFIGVLGGLFGIGLSYIVSIVANALNLAEKFVNQSGNISVIPLWLALLGVIFATLISMIAGLAPALKAMKLSPLMAIKNE